jgi:ELWxxDGT repeat protein
MFLSKIFQRLQFNACASKKSSPNRRSGRKLCVEKLDKRELFAVDLVEDIGVIPQSSNVSSIVEVPGLGAAYTANIPEGFSLITESGNTRRIHSINNKWSYFPDQLTHFRDPSGQDWIYFTAVDEMQDRELYRLNFTTRAINRVRDINPNGSSEPLELTVVNDKIYFTAWNVATGRELWITDGTSSGTALVKDIRTGIGQSSSPENLTKFGNQLLFTANNGSAGRELYRSSGTSQLTTMVKDIEVGSGSSDPKDLTVSGDRLYFSAFTNANGRELWRTNASSVGTVLVEDVEPGANSSDPIEITAWGNGVAFIGNRADVGKEVFRYEREVLNDVFLLKDIVPGALGSEPEYLVESGGSLYFVANSPAEGREVFRSFGISANTAVLRDINIGTGGSNPARLIDVDGRLYFSAWAPTTGIELYSSTGTTANTLLVKDINLGNGGSYPNEMAEVNGKLLFQAYEPSIGYELWRTSGTSSATKSSDLFAATSHSYPTNLTNFNSDLVFTAFENTKKLFIKPNGIGEKIQLSTSNSNWDLVDYSVAVVDDIFYFARQSRTGDDRMQLWKSDGTQAGTTLVKTIDGKYYVNKTIASNGSLYAVLFDRDALDFVLWTSDGTTAGTTQLKANQSFADISEVTTVGDTVYFAATKTGEGFTRLWRTQGTNETTDIVAPIDRITTLMQRGGSLYFLGQEGSSFNFYRYDGQSPPTVLKSGIVGYSRSGKLGVNLSGTLYFAGTSVEGESQIWKSNGTAAGTVLVKATSPVGVDGIPTFLMRLGNSLVFDSASSSSGRELWVSDGTSAGTKVLKHINSGIASSAPWHIGVVDGEFIFSAFDGSKRQIWKTDGTATGTTRVREINDRFVDIDYLYRDAFVTLGNRMFFVGNSRKWGYELFVYEKA